MLSLFSSASALLCAAAIGAMLFFAVVVAPLVFGRLPAEHAGPFNRALFPRYYLSLGATCATAAMLAAAAGRLEALLPAIVVAGCALARTVLIPRMHAVRDRELAGDATAIVGFRRLHNASVVLNLVQFAMLLAAAGTLV